MPHWWTPSDGIGSNPATLYVQGMPIIPTRTAHGQAPLATSCYLLTCNYTTVTIFMLTEAVPLAHGMSNPRFPRGAMASKLIAILERCGVRQSDIARELGVSRATVSRWASGERQTPKAQHDRLLTWASEAAFAAVVAAEAHDRAAATLPSRTLLDVNTVTAALLKEDLRVLWGDYTWEIQPTAFHAHMLRILQRWGAYAQDLTPDLFDPKPADIDQLWEDTKRLRGWMATWRRLHQPPARKDPSDAS